MSWDTVPLGRPSTAAQLPAQRTASWSGQAEVANKQHHPPAAPLPRRDAQTRRRLAAQLARTEEAAKRILIRSDASARGGTAQRLLDAERELCRLRADKAELESELERCAGPDG